MFVGMTGFGTAQVEDKWGVVRIDIRSWNGRGLDVSIRGPFLLTEWESLLRRELKRVGISRGTVRVDVFVQLRNVEYEVSVNEGLLSSLLRECSKFSQLSEQISVYEAVNIPGVVQYYPKDTSQITSSLLKAFHQAVKTLVDMRRKEGQEMFRVVHGLVREISDLSEKIRKRVRLLDKTGFFDKREDLSTLRKDVYEEVKRLKMNIKNFRSKMRSSGAKGRALDFIAQEILREANTFLAKIVDTELSNYALSVKLCADRIREVVQNVE